MTTQIKLTGTERKQLLSISRNTLKFCFENRKIQNRSFDKEDADYKCAKKMIVKYSALNIPVLQEILPCFVTLYSLEGNSKKLRGCIGSLEARNNETLLENLINNTLLAAFADSRFEPLEEIELDKISIEISILSKLQPVTFHTKEELFKKITGKGVVLQSGPFKATFLPQVWEQIDEPENFLRHLAQKAGISPGDYLHASYKIYEVYAFEESGEQP